MNQLESDGKWLGNLLVSKMLSTCAAKFSFKRFCFFLSVILIFVGYILAEMEGIPQWTHKQNPCCEARTTGSTLTGKEVTYQRCCSKFSEQTWKSVFWHEQNQQLQECLIFLGAVLFKALNPPQKKTTKNMGWAYLFPFNKRPLQGGALRGLTPRPAKGRLGMGIR